ncbi:unnamed protein product [Clonostachys chloroleuca]|uniref:F-box domain-containing protein n=1 Tax=Clonostachys chloroleuca TaxID=1926264 RepID=A0AA35LZR2_9HYPO|nr:unnamed protein product [Clonostachys chloroleuca]
MPGGRTSSVPMAWLNDARRSLSEGGTRSGRDVVDALIPLLSDWDIIYLRQRIAELRGTPTALAKFTDLSLDCIYLILPYLTMRDFLAMRLVSREWNRILSQPELIVILCRIYFPGISTQKAIAAGANVQEFSNIARLYSRKRADTCGKMFVPWDIESHTAATNITTAIRDDPTSDTGPRGKYLRHPTFETVCGDGKLVLLAHKNYLLVDDLAKGTRMKLALTADPRVVRRLMKVEAVTGKIIVMSSLPGPSLAAIAGHPAPEAARLRTIHVYHFELKVWRNVILPARIDECFAYDEKFVVSFHSKTVMLWTWTKGLVELPLGNPAFNVGPPGAENLYSSVAGVLFHPLDDNTIFLVWVYFFSGVHVSQNLFTIVVVKYNYEVDGDRWVSTKDYRHSISHPIPDPGPSNHCFGGQTDPLGACFSRRFSKTSPDGMYFVGLFFLVNYMSEQDNEGMCECVQPSWDKDCVRALTFNVCTESFNENRYYGFKDSWAVNIRTILRKGRGVTDQGTFDHIQVWNGELFNMVIQVLATGLTPVIEIIRGRQENGLPIATLSGDYDVETFKPISTQRAFGDGPFQVHAGTDYLVLAGGHGYALWRWDKERKIRPEKQQAGQDEPWLANGEYVSPDMRHFDQSSEEDFLKELHPPYADARCELYDVVVKLYHAPRDMALERVTD